MAYRIELINETTKKPIVVWDITDEIVRAYDLQSDAALTSYILRCLSRWANPDAVQACARAVLKTPNRPHRLPVQEVLRGGPAPSTVEVELIRLRERAAQAEQSARLWKTQHEQLSQEFVKTTAERDKAKQQLAQARREAAADKAVAEAQIAAFQAEQEQLRRRHSDHQSATIAAKSEARNLLRKLDEVDADRAELRRRLGDNQLLTADRNLR